MKRKNFLPLLLVTLMIFSLVGCGKKDNNDNDKKDEIASIWGTTEEKEEITTTEVTTEDNFDTSMDGGAPAPEVTTETISEAITEEVVPVETTFTLMSEDGSTVALEGEVPSDLTLVSGNGTSHIEFSYDINPDVTVYLDAGYDSDVLVLHHNIWMYDFNLGSYANSFDFNQHFEPYGITDTTPSSNTENAKFRTMSGYNVVSIDNVSYRLYGIYLDHLIKPWNDGTYRVSGCDCHCYDEDGNYTNDVPVDIETGDFGYATYKLTITFTDYRTVDVNFEKYEYPFTFTVKIDQNGMWDTTSNYSYTYNTAFVFDLTESFFKY